MNYILSPSQALFTRIITGLIIGIILALLQEPFTDNYSNKVIPHLWNNIFYFSFGFSAFIIWAAAGSMRIGFMALWVIAAAVLSGVIFGTDFWVAQGTGNWNSYTLWSFPLIFILNELIINADNSNLLVAPYKTYFENSWKHGIQLILALIFTAILWLILFLGSALLGIIGFDWLGNLLKQRIFALSVSGMAMGAAVHLSDIQPKLLGNVRKLILNVLSWLLIIIVLIGTIFIISLFISGLEPLWATKSATAYLLSACVFLVLLINAAYGTGENINRVLKIAIRIASVITLILSSIAAYGLYLRINQYGLTVERIFALVGVISALSFGISYTIANASLKEFMAILPKANVYISIAIAVVFICLLTPIANVTRLSVASQINMLQSSKVSVDKFDWWYIKYEGGQYGQIALANLQKDSRFAADAAKYSAMSQRDFLKSRNADNDKANTPLSQKANVLETAKNQPPLPQSFTNQVFSENDGIIPPCLMTRQDSISSKCYARQIDLNHDGKNEIVIIQYGQGYLMTFDGKRWQGNSISGTLNVDDWDNFKNGNYKLEKSQWDDIIIGNSRLKVQ